MQKIDLSDLAMTNFLLDILCLDRGIVDALIHQLVFGRSRVVGHFNVVGKVVVESAVFATALFDARFGNAGKVGYKGDEVCHFYWNCQPGEFMRQKS